MLKFLIGASIAALLTSSTAQAGELLRDDGSHRCLHLGWSAKAWKCAVTVGKATGRLDNAELYEKLSRFTEDADEAQRLRNKAAYNRAEAERLSNRYYNLFAPKQ